MPNKQTNKINIILAADNAYSEQVTTLIKSVCYHNKNVDFYLLNENEFAQPWFDSLNNHLAKLNSKIIPVRIIKDIINQFNLGTNLTYINKTTFYRYFLEEVPIDKCLYLDSDIIVEGSLSELYHIDLKDYFVAATPDFVLNILEHYYAEYPNMKPYFNAGMLLINNKKWREHNIQKTLLNMTAKLPNVLYADQDILNIVFRDEWLALDKIYNYQVGAKFGLLWRNLEKECNEVENLSGNSPVIIHYTSQYKPWKGLMPNNEILYADKYWFYYNLTWEEIIAQHK